MKSLTSIDEILHNQSEIRETAAAFFDALIAAFACFWAHVMVVLLGIDFLRQHKKGDGINDL